MPARRLLPLLCALALLVPAGPAAFAAEGQGFDLGGRLPVAASDLAEGLYDTTFACSDQSVAATSCQLTVKDKAMTVALTLSGKGRSSLFLGSAQDAQALTCPTGEPFYEGTATKGGDTLFTFPVERLNTVFAVAFCDAKTGKWVGCEGAILADKLYGEVIHGADYVKEATDPYASAAAVDLADGTYEVPVTLAGGSGKAHVESPAKVTVKDGKAVATIVWSSAYYDYAIVDGSKYLAQVKDGASHMDIPVLDAKLPMYFLANTTAMSAAHEIEYSLSFDFAKAQLAKEGTSPLTVAIIALVVIALIVVAVLVLRKRRPKDELDF